MKPQRGGVADRGPVELELVPRPPCVGSMTSGATASRFMPSAGVLTPDALNVVERIVGTQRHDLESEKPRPVAHPALPCRVVRPAAVLPSHHRGDLDRGIRCADCLGLGKMLLPMRRHDIGHGQVESRLGRHLVLHARVRSKEAPDTGGVDGFSAIGVETTDSVPGASLVTPVHPSSSFMPRIYREQPYDPLIRSRGLIPR